MKNFIDNEPVLSAAAITALAGAILGCLVAFGVPVTGDQVEAILNLVGILAPVVGALIGAAIARNKVTRNTHVLERLDGDRVVAGDANEVVASGQEVRKIGSLDAGD